MCDDHPMSIDQAFILAAGMAQRMRPLTDDTPKPLLKIGGKALLAHCLDRLREVDVHHVIVNGHHALPALQDYMEWVRPYYPEMELIVSEEEELLETGGGLVKAMPYLDKEKPFYMINGDAYWVDSADKPTLQALAEEWDPQHHDILLLLQSCASMSMTDAVGDYDIDTAGMAKRSLDKTGTHMFAGVRIAMPHVVDGRKIEKFSFLEQMDAAESKGRLGGLNHQGDWYHISTPKDLEEVNQLLFQSAS